ncbi:flippase [Phytopseudomonas straminea]|uniref:Polysaccharide transporter, PST family n=1 Tax=Pseudomonas straminea TaxID=47882 RepID=A0A1I1SQS5_PSEOC|nr:flippase [Pseudomonas straminea]SFD48804.1 polysaccharide transporter, PST family [Pseudomonas straminea]
MNILPTFIRQRLIHRPNTLRVIDNIAWLTFDKILRLGVGLIVSVWVARYLGPEQFGLFSFATAFAGIFSAIAGLGLASIVVRDLVTSPPSSPAIMGSALLIQLVGGVVSYGLMLVLIAWLRPGDDFIKLIVAIVGVGVVLKGSDVAVYWFEAQVQSKYIVWVQNGTFLIFAMVRLFLIFSKAPLLAFALSVFFEAIVVSLLMLIALHSKGIALSSLRSGRRRILGLLRDSWPLLLSAMSIMVYMKIDQIMLGQMLGEEAVGIFSAAVRVSEVWYFLPLTVCASLFPGMLLLRETNRARYMQRLQLLFGAMVWLSLVVAIFMMFSSTWIVVTLFGEAYAPASGVLATHIWASVFVSLGVISGQWLVAEGLQILSMQRAVLGALANVLLNLLLIPAFSVNGAAMATVISFAIVALFSDLINRETRFIFWMKIKSLLLPFTLLLSLRS